jgi:8-oxo-dGTP pyrophosphatase MutT (NUDIX family)
MVSELFVDARFRCRLICSTRLDKVELASVGHGHYVVVVLHVGGSKASDIKLVLQRETRNGKTWFLAGSIMHDEELVDVVVRELLEETCLTLTFDDLTMLHYPKGNVSLITSFRRLFRFPA